jgi:hypothetical protein
MRSTTRPTSISVFGSATTTRTSTHSACSRCGVPPTLPRHPRRRPPLFLPLRRHRLHRSRSSRRRLLLRLLLQLLHRLLLQLLRLLLQLLPRPLLRRQIAPLTLRPGRAPLRPDAQPRAVRRFVPHRATGLPHPHLASSLRRRARSRRCRRRATRLVRLAMRPARPQRRLRRRRVMLAPRPAASPARPSSLGPDRPSAEETQRPCERGRRARPRRASPCRLDIGPTPPRRLAIGVRTRSGRSQPSWPRSVR